MLEKGGAKVLPVIP